MCTCSACQPICVCIFCGLKLLAYNYRDIPHIWTFYYSYLDTIVSFRQYRKWSDTASPVQCKKHGRGFLKLFNLLRNYSDWISFHPNQEVNLTWTMIPTYPNSWQLWKEQTNYIELIRVSDQKKSLKNPPTHTHIWLSSSMVKRTINIHSCINWLGSVLWSLSAPAPISCNGNTTPGW